MPRIDQRDDTRSSDVYTVLEENEVDLTKVCYDHWVSFPEGMTCPDCDKALAVVATALQAVQ
jgi:hypothetical protein